MPKDLDGPYHLPLHWGNRLHAIGSNTQYLHVLAGKAGLSFNFDAQGSNTLDSHRLLLHAERVDEMNNGDIDGDDTVEGGGQGGERTTFALALRLAFASAYFKEGKRLADHAVLMEKCVEVGLDVDAVRAVLKGDTYRDEVLASADELTRSGIHSIPVFLFRSGEFRARVHGSASEEAFTSVFRDAEAHWAKLDGGGG